MVRPSSGAQVITTQSIGEGHLWAGGSVSDKATFFAELTASSERTIEVELAQVYFNDLVGPAHAVNLRVGRGYSNVSSYGPHSSYLRDALIAATAVAELNGASSDSWRITDPYNGVELSGVIAGRVGYNVGWNAGANHDARSAEDVYGHLSVKFGGMRLDGEGNGTTQATRPWEETAVTLDGFAYHARFGVTFPGESEVLLNDTANTLGGAIRAQWGSLELNSGVYLESHLHAQIDGSSASALAHYDELSYVIVPWLVPAVRFEFTRIRPDSACGGGDGSCATVTDRRVIPGVAFLPYPNLKFVVAALIESASGKPPGGWGPVDGSSEGTGSGLELQNVVVSAAFAF